jgi:hypothetical protein
LICSSGEEMSGKVALPMNRCPAGAHMPGDDDGRERENEKQRSEMAKWVYMGHKKDIKVHGLRAANSIGRGSAGYYREGSTFCSYA